MKESLKLKEKLDLSNIKINKRMKSISKLEEKVNKEDIEVVKVAKDFKTYNERMMYLNNYYTLKNYSYDKKDLINQLYDNYMKLSELESIKNNWQVKYDTQLNKENAPKIKVLWDFLNDWGSKVVEWYTKNSEHYVKVLNEYKELQRKFYEENDYANADEITKNKAEFNFIKYLKETYYFQLLGKQIYGAKEYAKYIGNIPSLTIDLTKVKFIQDENYNYWKLNNVAYAYGEYKIINFDKEELIRIVEEEKLNKYFDLCNRISKVVGEITNVDRLSIGDKQGELNGLVEGTKCKCYVETISAGGYNIQCFHYRVLIKEVK